MRARTKTALAIDIGHDRVGLALVAHEADAFKLVRSISRPLSGHGAPNAGIEDVFALSRLLKKLRRQGRIPRKKAALGLSVSPLVLQILDLPRPIPPNVGEFVENELRQYVTLSGKKILCDFCAVGSAKGSQKRLLAIGVDKERIGALVKACSAAGLTVETIEPSILSYARAVCREKSADTGVDRILIVEINAHQLAACLLGKSGLDFVRTKHVPADVDSPERVREWLGEEIETMMRHCDLESSETSYRWDVRILIRDGARVSEDIAESLKARTGAHTEAILDSNDSASRTARGTDHVPASGTSLTAQGLAMKLLNPSSDGWKVNVLPRDVTQARSFTRHVLATAGVAALILLGMLASPRVLTGTADRMHRDLERRRVTEKLYTTPTLAAEAHAVDRQLQQIRHQLRDMEQVLQERTRVDWSRVLNAIAENMPTGACITRLWSQGALRLSVEGLALSCDTVQSFVQALGERELFESVSLGNLERQQDSNALVRYKMDCFMKPSQ